jgi:hypothetical protein
MPTFSAEFSAEKNDIPGILREIARLVELGFEDGNVNAKDESNGVPGIYWTVGQYPEAPVVPSQRKWEGSVTVKKADENADLSDAQDEGLDGTEASYRVEAFTEAGAVEKVKDRFHDEIAIACLDDFEIDVEVKEVPTPVV